ncbi:MAG: energy-coupling factor transporter transmembrane component T [Brachybacterium sp.]
MLARPTAATAPGHSGPWVDPRAKLIVLLVVNVVLIAMGTNPDAVWAKPALAAVPLLLAALAGLWGLAAWYGIAYAAAWTAETLWSPVLEGAPALVLVAVTGLVLRIGPSAACAIYLIRTTTVGEFIAALQRARVPQVVVIPLAVMLRFLPTTAEEHRAISDAMRLRGIGGLGVLRDPVRTLEHRFVPLLTSLVRIGDDLSAAAVTRALGAPWPRTSIAPSGMGVLDWALILGTVAIAAAQVFA